MLTADDLLPAWIGADVVSAYLDAEQGKRLALWSDGSTTIVDSSARWAYGCGPLGMAVCPGVGNHGDMESIRRTLLQKLSASMVELEEIENEVFAFDCEMARFDADH